MTPNDISAVKFTSVTEHDFEELLALRILVMRESLDRIGRFDPVRARERFASTFQPQHTRRIFLGGAFVGCVALKPDKDGLLLEHFYFLPAYQGHGLGGKILSLLLAEAGVAQLQVRLSVLKKSDAARFYERHGFVKTGEDEWDIYYTWMPINTKTSH
jgi:GNAT superfamily N-acetyltransferase